MEHSVRRDVRGWARVLLLESQACVAIIMVAVAVGAGTVGVATRLTERERSDVGNGGI